jgi:hypothetical protein
MKKYCFDLSMKRTRNGWTDYSNQQRCVYANDTKHAWNVIKWIIKKESIKVNMVSLKK